MGRAQDAGGDSGLARLGGGGRSMFRWRSFIRRGRWSGVAQVPKLGPDILSDEFTVEGGVARLAAYGRENPDAEIAVVLLNQRVMAGLGNVYKSEVAFAAGVNPFRAMRTITRARDGEDGGLCAAVYEGECRGWEG